MLRRSSRGFTLVEVLIGVTILGILVAMGAPAMGRYLQNSKLGSAASGYFTALQLARAEAIRRNVQTQFVLTDDGGSPSLTGRNWVVRAASGVGFEPIDSKSGVEGEGNPGASALTVAASGTATGFNGAIVFNGFGSTVGNAAYWIDISNPRAGTCTAAGGQIRCRQVTVSPSGQIAACVPGVTASAGDSRAC